MTARPNDRPGIAAAPLPPLRDAALLFAALLAVGALVYAPALSGPFISDDSVYLSENPWVQQVSVENVAAILDPASSNNLLTANYAPTQMLLHMAQWTLFGADTLGYHLANLVLHALIGVLFAALLLRSGASRWMAAACAALLLFHPASAEVVCWISQLKTLLAMSFVLGALLLRDRSPLGGAALFLIGLFAKPMAAVGLPFLIAEEWVRRGRGAPPPVDKRSLLIWTASFALFAGVAFGAYRAANLDIPPLSDDPWIRGLAIAAFAARYLVMAVTGYGVSAFQEPPVPAGAGDLWVLLAIVLVGGFSARLAIAFGRRLPELPYWVWAAAAFLPVSQLVPFRFPMADRYLYFLLPGLIGGAALAATRAWRRVPEPRRVLAARSGAAAVAVLLAIFVGWSCQRAGLWAEVGAPTREAVMRWPNGAQAHRDFGRALVYNGRWDEALPELLLASERRALTLPGILKDPVLAPQMGDPRLEPLLRDIAQRELEIWGSAPQATEYGWIRLAQAQLLAREFDAAKTSLAHARTFDGSYGPLIDGLGEFARKRIPLAPKVVQRR